VSAHGAFDAVGARRDQRRRLTVRRADAPMRPGGDKSVLAVDDDRADQGIRRDPADTLESAVERQLFRGFGAERCSGER
jgi:hypothetical protein